MNLCFTASLLIILLSPITKLHAQGDISLHYLKTIIIPYDYKLDDTTIGGLSALTYNAKDSYYYAVADKPPSRVYQIKIDFKDDPKVLFQSVLKISPPLLIKSELEGIAINQLSGKTYVSDEQNSGSRIFEIDKTGTFKRIIEPINNAFLPLSGHNSGIEGLTISADGTFLYYAFERPIEDCLQDGYVLIKKLSLKEQTNQASFHYQLHEVAADKLNSNGISEILYLNDSSLLVMERAYIPGQGNVVRLYQTLLSMAKIDANNSCSQTSVYETKSRIVYDFADVEDEFEIDNAEGITFNEDKSMLIIVTDNNFSRSQETQIVLLETNLE